MALLTLVGRKYSIGSSLVDLLSLNDPNTLILLHRFSGDISFATLFLALSCSWEVLQDSDSDHQAILLTVPLSQFFRSNERSPSFNFEKAR